MAKSFIDDHAIEKECKTKWDRDPLIRAEFGGNYESYLAYKKAEARGAVGIYGQAQRAG